MNNSALCIQNLGDLVDTVAKNDESLEDVLYSLYKQSYKFSYTNCFRGNTADEVKEYIRSGPLNCINGLMNVSSEFLYISQLITEAFNQYETSKKGRIADETLEYISNELPKKANPAYDIYSTISQILTSASNYDVEITPIGLEKLRASFESAQKRVHEISDTVLDIDTIALAYANELYTRCETVKKQIKSIKEYCYNAEKFVPDNARSLTSQKWYKEEGNVALYTRMQEDPFKYEAGEYSVSEEQWAKGLCKDIYAYAGYSFVQGEYEAGNEGGKYFLSASGAVLAANAYLQVTEYVKAKGEAKVFYGEVKANSGFSEDYKGYDLEGEVGLVKVDGSVTIGTDELNAFVKGEVKILEADGKIACSYSDGELKLGVDANVTAVDASGKAGVSIFTYKYKATPSSIPKDAPLLGVYCDAEAGVKAGVSAWVETKTAIESENVNINTITLKLGASALVGGKVTVTLPYVHIKEWPWNW